MRDDPRLDEGTIVECLETQYGFSVASAKYLPIGYDLSAFVYEVIPDNGASYFLKVRSGPIHEPTLQLPRALIDHGVPNILAPIRTCTSDLWCSLDGYEGYTVVLYPFIHGESVMATGLTDGQWREFGRTLRAVHDSGLDGRFSDQLRAETFALPSAALVHEMLALVAQQSFESPAATQFAAFWRENASRIRDMLARAEELGRSLQSKRFELVLCHSDIHAANILAGDDGRIWLVDWDDPIIAPRERDLLFVVGSRIARTVEPEEEERFFEGYGLVEIDPVALSYYRYERLVEDIGEIGKRVFVDPDLGERSREEAAELAMGFFESGADIDHAENVTVRHSADSSD